jgi:AcrR family transcriptional regulator
MPRPRLTKEEIAAMRERILDAASELLHEEGRDGLSIRAIADRVGVSHMVLYTYFDNRDALFTALRDRHRQRVEAQHEDLLNRARTDDPIPVIRGLLEDYVRFARRNPPMFRFVWAALYGAPDCAPAVHRSRVRDEIGFLRDLIQIGIDRGSLAERDAATAAIVLTGMVTGSLTMAHQPGLFDEGTLERVEDELVSAGMTYLMGQKETYDLPEANH